MHQTAYDANKLHNGEPSNRRERDEARVAERRQELEAEFQAAITRANFAADALEEIDSTDKYLGDHLTPDEFLDRRSGRARTQAEFSREVLSRRAGAEVFLTLALRPLEVAALNALQTTATRDIETLLAAAAIAYTNRQPVTAYAPPISGPTCCVGDALPKRAEG